MKILAAILCFSLILSIVGVFDSLELLILVWLRLFLLYIFVCVGVGVASKRIQLKTTHTSMKAEVGLYTQMEMNRWWQRVEKDVGGGESVLTEYRFHTLRVNRVRRIRF